MPAMSTRRDDISVGNSSGHTASSKLGKMILPQLEQGTHGVEVVGMFFL
jgi:hypothetical protein